MSRVLKIVGVVIGLAVGLVAGVFGLIVVAVIFVLAALVALFGGKGNFRVNVNRGRPAASRPPPNRFGGGDVIDVEAKPVEAPRRELL